MNGVIANRKRIIKDTHDYLLRFDNNEFTKLEEEEVKVLDVSKEKKYAYIAQVIDCDKEEGIVRFFMGKRYEFKHEFVHETKTEFGNIHRLIEVQTASRKWTERIYYEITEKGFKPLWKIMFKRVRS